MSAAQERRKAERGFASLEVLAAVTILAIVLLSIATMFLTAYGSIDRSGDTTVAAALARQILEEVRSVPFENLQALDGFDTGDPGTLPADEPARGIARRWRYAVAGEGDGWTFTDGEILEWSDYGTAVEPMGGVVEVTAPSSSMRRVTVTLTPSGPPDPIRMATLISRTES